MINMRSVIKGVDKVIKAIDTIPQKIDRDLNSAFRVEGFKLKNQLQLEIRAGAPGGVPFKPDTYIHRGLKKNPKKVLRKLALGIRYYVPNSTNQRLQVGFVGPVNQRELETMTNSGVKFGSHGGYRGIKAGGMTSNSWRKLGAYHQEGFRRDISPIQRAWLAKTGSKIKDRSLRQYFFLKPTTTQFITPSRPIIDPFWAKYRNRTMRNIRINFLKKTAGYKI